MDNKNEYIKFSSVLNTIGEEYICLLEHIDNQYASDSPFKGVIKTCEGFEAFRRLETRSSFWIDFIEFLYFWSKSELGNLLM